MMGEEGERGRDPGPGGGLCPRGLEGDDRSRFEGLLQAGDPVATGALRDFEMTLLELAAAATEAPPVR